MIDASDNNNGLCYSCQKEKVTANDGIQLCDKCRSQAEEEAKEYAHEKADEYASEKADARAIDVADKLGIDQDEAWHKIYDAEYKAAFPEHYKDKLDKAQKRMLGEDEDEWED